MDNLHGEPFRGQEVSQQFAQVNIVVDQQDSIHTHHPLLRL
jgi:hypothetical protein